MKIMKKSFSLIEVLVFVTIFSLFFVAAATVVVVSLRNMKTSEHKIIATRYAEELLEWLRSQKEIDWNVFNSSHSGTYCFSTSPISTWPSNSPCGGYLESIFKREVTLTRVDANKVNVVITVTWTEMGTTYKVPINSVFTIWESQ